MNEFMNKYVFKGAMYFIGGCFSIITCVIGLFWLLGMGVSLIAGAKKDQVEWTIVYFWKDIFFAGIKFVERNIINDK